jgi:hypothetical protein
VVSGEPRALGYPEVRWASAGEMARYAFPVTDRKIAESLRGD